MARQWWVFYVSGETWQKDQYVREIEETEDSEAEGCDWGWTCNEGAEAGDYGLLYARKPISAIVGVFRVTQNARRKHHRFGAHPWVCHYGCVAILDDPITFRQMRADKELSDVWGLVRGQFQPPGGIPPRVPINVLKLVGDKFPELTAYIATS